MLLPPVLLGIIKLGEQRPNIVGLWGGHFGEKVVVEVGEVARKLTAFMLGGAAAAAIVVASMAGESVVNGWWMGGLFVGDQSNSDTLDRFCEREM